MKGCCVPGCPDDMKARGYCVRHYNQARFGRPPTLRKLSTKDFIEEVEWLGTTDAPENIARRLGTTPGALERRFRRAGRPDLANRFRRIEWEPETPAWWDDQDFDMKEAS